MNNFEWRDGQVRFKCGRCGGYTVTAGSLTSFGYLWLVAYCTSEACKGTWRPWKRAHEWSGIVFEALNLKYSK